LRQTCVVLLGLLCCSCNCGRSRLNQVTTPWQVTPTSLTVHGYVGFTSTGSVTLSNPSVASLQASLSTASPFSVAPTIELDPGESRPISISYQPAAPGMVQGQLLVDANGREVQVALTLIAEVPPTCVAPDCQQGHFDPDAGGCAFENLPDNTHCQGGACLLDAHCETGRCIGQSVDCDDGNPCTVGVCDATQGCTHLTSLDACPSPNDPCKVATCSVDAGCGFAPALDGTSCGASDCDHSNVCLNGSCQLVATPEDSPCGVPSSYCQPAGRCQSGVCNQPPATAPHLAWSYSPTPPFQFMQDLLADDHGQLYWEECANDCSDSQQTCQLVSVTADGLSRWRQSVSVSGFGSRHMIDGEFLFRLVTPTYGGYCDPGARLEAYRLSDGSSAWSVDLEALFGLNNTNNPLGAENDLATDGNGQIYLAAAAYSYLQGWLASFDRETGQVLWTIPFSEDVHNAFSDGTWVYTALGGFPATLDEVAPNVGSVLHTLANSTNEPIAVDDGAVAQYFYWTGPDGGELISTQFSSTANGNLLASTGGWAYLDWRLINPVMQNKFAAAVEVDSAVEGFDLSAGQMRWSIPLDEDAGPGLVYDLLLTDKPSVLFAEHRYGPGINFGQIVTFGPELREVALDGGTLSRCPLPPDAGYRNPVLLPNRWVVFTMDPTWGGYWSLKAFDVPGDSPALSGWSANYGDSMRRNFGR
jgi:hypothetical protein